MAPVMGVIGIEAGYVLAAITLFVLPIAATAFAESGPSWESLGKGRYGIERALPPPRLNGPAPPVDKALQAAEARQMLEAKSYRRQRRGQPPIDVDAEMRRLLESAEGSTADIDEKLRAEIRELVVARNERRMSNGRQPLDIEAEIERQLSDFIGLAR